MPGQWNHAVAVYDGKTIFITCAPVTFETHIPMSGTTEVNTALHAIDQPFTIGGRFDETSAFFSGSIDELLVFQRALTADGINKLFRLGKQGIAYGNHADATLPATDKSEVFIRNGAPSDNVVIEGDRKQSRGTLRLAGAKTTLKLTPQISFGNFSLKLKMSFPHPESVDAKVTVGADGFHFDGKDGLLKNFGNEGIRDYRDQPLKFNWTDVVEPGKAFTLALQRRNGTLTITLDGKLIYTNTYTRDTVGEVTLSPGTGTVSIAELSVRGQLDHYPSQTVFRSGENGVSNYRIPALLCTPNGTLLAFAEARQDNARDLGNIDIVMKRSEDNGRTWSPATTIYEEGGTAKITCANPAPVLDRDTGRVWLFFQVCKRWGAGDYKLMATYSDDEGRTWAEPCNIKATAAKPDWVACHPGPGHGIQISTGPHKGRLVMPAWHTMKDPNGFNGRRNASHVFYSDDHGKSWQVGGIASQDSDECMVAECADGALMMSIRPFYRNVPDPLYRRKSFSQDGGLTWSKPIKEQAFKSVICQASVWSVADPDAYKPQLLLCHPGAGNYSDYREHRAGLTVWTSDDNSRTWHAKRLLNPGRSAYSDMDMLPNNTIGCLFEGHNMHTYNAIKFLTFELDNTGDK
jgi:sialidase-1